MLLPSPQAMVAMSPSAASAQTSVTLAGGAVGEAEEVPEGEAEALDEALTGDSDGEEEVEEVEEGEGVSLKRGRPEREGEGLWALARHQHRERARGVNNEPCRRSHLRGILGLARSGARSRDPGWPASDAGHGMSRRSFFFFLVEVPIR